MKQKEYSIIIVSGATSTNKEFVISRKLIQNSIIAFSILLLIFGFVIFDYLTISFEKEKMLRLEAENMEKEETISKLTKNFTDINESVLRMEEYKKRIMVVAGLESPYVLKEVGIGGFGPTTLNKSSNSIQDVSQNVEIPNIGKNNPSRDNILKSTEDLRKKTRNVEMALKYVRSHIDEQKERLACTPSIWPTNGYLTDSFGPRRHPFTGKMTMHTGQDIATQHGNQVVATADGYVLVTDRSTFLGNVVMVDHGFGFITKYGHLASFNVKEGDRVKRGQVIGFVGNTGRSTAPHLHYEVVYMRKNQNPLNYIIN